MSQLDADGAYGHRNKVTLAERIHARLDELGLSMNKLNERCGFGQGYVSRLAAGKRRSPRGDTLEVLAAGLRVTVQWLVSGAGQKEDGIELPEHGLPPQADTAIRVAVARGTSVDDAVAAAARYEQEARAAEKSGAPFDIEVWLAKILEEERPTSEVEREQEPAVTYETARGASRRGNLARVRAFLYERYPKLDVDLAIGSSEFIGAENIDELAACIALDRILSRQKFETRHRKPALGERPLKPERRTSPSGRFSFDVPPSSTVPPAAEGKDRRR